MSFTDKDMKMWKERFPLISSDGLQALIARLEAAEKVIPHAKALSARCKQEQLSVYAEVDDVDDAEAEWRKTAGK